MSDSTLYKSCLRKVVINLRKRFYTLATTNRANYFESVPSMLVDAIMSEALNYQRTKGFSVDDLKPLLISGRLQELKISYLNVLNKFRKIHGIKEILGYLQSGCKNLKTLHLQVLNRYEATSIPEIKDALHDILTTSDLEDLNCCFNFDLRYLINCTNLRRLSLHFFPDKRVCDFLEEKEGSFKTHQCLELFNICPHHEIWREVPIKDIEIILRHCPKLTSLGFIESSAVIGQLDEEMTSQMKLRHCYWKDSADNDFHRIGEAVKRYTNIEELDFFGCRPRSVPCLQNLRSLVFLHIALESRVSSTDFINALQVIGPNLKHLSLRSPSPMDVSLVLHNCPNLESFKIFGSRFAEFTIPAVTLSNLERITIYHDYESKVLRLFRGCTKLKELFIFGTFLNEAFGVFLDSNSLLCLNEAGFRTCELTEHCFRELLLRAPHLEKIFHSDENYDLIKIIDETNHGVRLYDRLLLNKRESFYKRSKIYEC